MKRLMVLMFLPLLMFAGTREFVFMGGVENEQADMLQQGEFRLYLDFSPELKFNTFISGFRDGSDITATIGWGLEYRIRFFIAPYFGIGACLHYIKKDGYFDLVNYDTRSFLDGGNITYGGYANAGIRVNFFRNFAVLVEEKGGVKPSLMDYNVLKIVGLSFSWTW